MDRYEWQASGCTIKIRDEEGRGVEWRVEPGPDAGGIARLESLFAREILNLATLAESQMRRIGELETKLASEAATNEVRGGAADAWEAEADRLRIENGRLHIKLLACETEKLRLGQRVKALSGLGDVLRLLRTALDASLIEGHEQSGKIEELAIEIECKEKDLAFSVKKELEKGEAISHLEAENRRLRLGIAEIALRVEGEMVMSEEELKSLHADLAGLLRGNWEPDIIAGKDKVYVLAELERLRNLEGELRVRRNEQADLREQLGIPPEGNALYGPLAGFDVVKVNPAEHGEVLKTAEERKTEYLKRLRQNFGPGVAEEHFEGTCPTCGQSCHYCASPDPDTELWRRLLARIEQISVAVGLPPNPAAHQSPPGEPAKS